MRLQRRFPTLYPVTLKMTTKLEPETWGETLVVRRGGKKHLQILLRKGLPYPADLIVLLHEYAHCMVWRPDHQDSCREGDHDGEWGLAVARVERWYADE